uniref:Autophagy-related protein 16 domain-containing protein n=1 Tax=Chlamydomonas chlamydogama TaxID=225041 RepID=A0A7S2QUN2_9CHLO|mmetsp:Transcript_1879/g.4181  ORF Transcript_1879/g.4181 Transcript_1879/m.4181 type:complete len:628 (+) Transcript_1879:174-2057(+)|eukprot:CAMPEP_0202899548 /NCGR_PEP_ID=MMETSP1392-20130828/7744_1 /ASSEMBLY_ACC=CAM_ASM_000868 /TAXON_ID=225041 /ORGANISM="Chlamydomonas chlamydogama, Strain SAG 11-48b" /LENGTH=627 /DNA_ID=CAMNT_0049585749 /DNA_START=100 /DNA_END=1983 /DNA_ORIENTATION=+
MQCPAPEWIYKNVRSALVEVYSAQTAPFTAIFQEHMQCLQQLHELQVRLRQLDKEGVELREENAELHRRLNKLEELGVQDLAVQLEAARTSNAELEREVSKLLRSKTSLLEELMAASGDVSAARRQAEEDKAAAEKWRAEAEDLSARLATTTAELQHEVAARTAAASEVEGAAAAKEAALAETEQLRGENARLVRHLVQLKEKEIERMNEINKMHEEMLQQAAMMRKEAAADREAAEMIRARLAADRGAAAGSGSGSPPAAAPAGAPVDVAAGYDRISLKDLMDLPGGRNIASCQRVLPKAPYRSTTVHKGGCSSLASQIPGHLIASCGMDRVVQLWDSNSQDSSTGPFITLSGMTGSINGVTFTCDGNQLLAAGSDKSMILWDVASGHNCHTLTGHSASVTGVAANPLDNRLAASCADDRCIKLWDLSRGFSVRSIPCTKMPNCISISRDGNNILTGHLDGTLCMWDARQARASSTSPIFEKKQHTQAICDVSPTNVDSLLLVASRDNSVCMVDVRNMGVTRVFKAPQMTVGTIGSLGRGHCHIEMSVDGRFLGVGSAEGGVYVWDLNAPSSKAATNPATGLATVSTSTVLRHHKEAVVAVSWNNDVSSLVTADKAGVVAFWSLVG